MNILLKYTGGLSIFLVLLNPSFSPLAWADSVNLSETVPYGRYLTLKLQPSVEQADVLSAVIQVHFSPMIQTVGDAVHDVLRYSGYALIEESQQSADLKDTLKKPLPFVYRDLGPLPLRQVLSVLIGAPFELEADLLHRTINFKLKSAIQSSMTAVSFNTGEKND
jgi:conjugative transfer region protein (TIGR03748 family)